MNLIQTLEQEAIEALSKDKNIPEFRAGDTLRIGVKVVEGERTRVQNYEGVCIARSNRGMGSNFTVRKISFGEGVERVFPLYSPIVDSITVVRRGVVRRAKLYYLRGRRGKSARIAERRDPRGREYHWLNFRRDRGRARRGDQRHAQEEAATGTGHARHPQRSVHQPRELRADREAEPRSAVAARRRLVGLHELVEDGGVARGLDADAGVAHLDAGVVGRVGGRARRRAPEGQRRRWAPVGGSGTSAGRCRRPGTAARSGR